MRIGSPESNKKGSPKTVKKGSLQSNSALEALFQSRFPGLLYCANAVLLFGP